jgi:hypothetical protein
MTYPNTHEVFKARKKKFKKKISVEKHRKTERHTPKNQKTENRRQTQHKHGHQNKSHCHLAHVDVRTAASTDTTDHTDLKTKKTRLRQTTRPKKRVHVHRKRRFWSKIFGTLRLFKKKSDVWNIPVDSPKFCTSQCLFGFSNCTNSTNHTIHTQPASMVIPSLQQILSSVHLIFDRHHALR